MTGAAALLCGLGAVAVGWVVWSIAREIASDEMPPEFPDGWWTSRQVWRLAKASAAFGFLLGVATVFAVAVFTAAAVAALLFLIA